MARTKRNAMLIAEAREKIRTTQLINRLQDHALGLLDVPMDMSQIRAIEILLKKRVPDLSAVQMEAGDGLDKLFASLMDSVQGRSQVRPDDDHSRTTH